MDIASANSFSYKMEINVLAILYIKMMVDACVMMAIILMEKLIAKAAQLCAVHVPQEILLIATILVPGSTL